jgi:GMP synthase (glutamine-hydrolysing)
VFELGVPILGICYGQQVMMQMLGGEVVRGEGTAEFGRAYVDHTDARHRPADRLVPRRDREQVWMSHGDHVSRIAPGFEVYGTSPRAPYAITADLSRNFYAVQFHPEVHHTPNGKTLYENFVRLAGFKGDWTMAAYRDEAIRQIREQVGDAKVICGLSGGVDSSVAAVLIHEAIGDQLTCVFVDHGLLRQNEADEVVTMFRDHYNIPLIHADEASFSWVSWRVSDPETKRKTIGRLFIDVFQHYADEDRRRGVPRPGHALPGCHRKRVVFRRPLRHHQEPPQCRRPAREDGPEAGRAAARAVQGRGARAGPRAGPARQSFIGRHPFPGPGLAIRCPGEITREKLDILRKADAVYIDQIRRTGFMTRSGRPSSPSCRCAPWA